MTEEQRTKWVAGPPQGPGLWWTAARGTPGDCWTTSLVGVHDWGASHGNPGKRLYMDFIGTGDGWGYEVGDPGFHDIHHWPEAVESPPLPDVG